jgi:hypothetical protein
MLLLAKVKIEDIIDRLDSEMRKALRDAVNEVVQGASFDEYELFRTFKRKVSSKCRTWESVPDKYVEKDQC